VPAADDEEGIVAPRRGSGSPVPSAFGSSSPGGDPDEDLPKYEFGYGPNYGGAGDEDGYQYVDLGDAARYEPGPGALGDEDGYGYEEPPEVAAGYADPGLGLPDPEPDDVAAADYAHAATADTPPSPVVGPTPALRGQPGGPGIDVPGATGADDEERDPYELSGLSAWQQAQAAWLESGIEWQRPLTGRGPAEAEWNRIHAARARLRKRLGRRGASSAPRGGRRAVLVTGVTAAVVIVAGVAAVLVLRGGKAVPGTSVTSGYPPAALAGADFTTDPAARGRGIFQSVSRIVESDGTIVAVGSQAGARIARAQFFVSVDGGHSWRLAPVQAAGGGEPPPGHAARLVAGGQGAWVAVGADSIWTSKDGRSWTLSSGRGIVPMAANDRVLVLTRTGNGFLAGGMNGPIGDRAHTTAVIWTSRDGIGWKRLTAGQLGIAAGSGQLLNISYAASRGRDTVIDGEISTTSGGGKVTTSFGAWHSTDGGTAWAPAAVPVSNGAGNLVDGIGASATGFVAVRPGASGRSGPGAVAYVSADGAAWTYAATITAPSGGLQVSVVKGSSNGFAVAGQTAGGNLVTYASPDGRSWRGPATLGRAASESVSGVTAAPGGTVIAIGATTAGPVSQRPVFAAAGAQGNVVNVDLGGIAGAADPEVAVDGIAVSGDRLVAVGSEDGFPAAWSTAGSGGWSRGSGVTPGVLQRPGLQELDAVVHGRAGWLAVGGASGAVTSGAGSGGAGSGAAQHPVVVTSVGGQSWQAADGEGVFAAPGTVTSQAAAGPSGYVIVGKQVAGGRTVAAAWWSTGLSGWAHAGNAGTGDLDGQGGPRQMLAVTASDGGFVAVGSAGGRPEAWTSADGQRWRAVSVPLPGGAGSGVLQQVAANGRRIVATGAESTAAGTVPFAAVSADGGGTWRETVLNAPGGSVASGPVSVTALAAAGSRFTAVGTSGSAGNADVVVWASADGSTWKASAPSGTGLSGPGVQELTALTGSGTTLTGVGFTATPLGEQPTLWKATAH